MSQEQIGLSVGEMGEDDDWMVGNGDPSHHRVKKGPPRRTRRKLPRRS